MPASGYLMGTYENPANAGDGYAMAYHAGAELTNIECFQVNPLLKDYNGPACAYVNGSFGGYTVNAKGNRFMLSDYWSGKMMWEFYRELHSENGPVYLKMDHLAPETVNEIEQILHTTERPSRGRFHAGRGVSYGTNLVEMAISEIPLQRVEALPERSWTARSTGVTTTHSIQVRSDFAEKYLKLAVAYLKATLEADRLIRENPERLTEDIARWTGIDAEVVYAFHGPQGIQTRDYTLEPEFVDAIRQAQETLKILKKVEVPINVDEFVNDTFIREAAKELGDDYDARLRDYGPFL